MNAKHYVWQRGLVALTVAGLALLSIGSAHKTSAQTVPSALLVEMEGAIGPAANDHLKRAMKAAFERRAKLIILVGQGPGNAT